MLSASKRILFICEHGAAKSLMAATYFNHLAEKRGLPILAIARGTSPNPAIPSNVLKGLAEEGLTPATSTPLPFTEADLPGVIQVITFDQPQLADRVPKDVQWATWDALPAVSADFGAARQAILGRVSDLIAAIAAGRGMNR